MAPQQLAAIVFALVLGAAWSGPAFYHEPESHGLAVSGLSSRLAAHAQDARLPPLPSPQDLEAIKKVAQILIMLGQQVIPAIIGEPPSGNCDNLAAAVVDAATDTVKEKTT